MKRGDGILKVIVLVFTAITIGNTIEYFFINKDNLRHVQGKVENIVLERYQCGYSIFSRRYCEKTEIYIEGVSNSFSVKDRVGRGAYVDGIHKGDKVDIYIRKWYQYILTFGSYRNIYILEKNGEVYYDFERGKSSNKSLIIVSGIIAVFFGGLYVLQRKTINQLMKRRPV
jgi:hypothetical protein